MKKLALISLLLLAPSLSWADGTAPVKHSKEQNASQAKPLAVDPKLSIKDNEASAIELPGVMTIDGKNPNALDFNRTRTLTFSNGASKTIFLSDHDFNRIQTPFPDPVVIMKKGSISSENASGSNNLYLAFKPDNLKPIQIFIENPDGSSMGLQLIPKDIPAQTILIQDGESSKHSVKNTAPETYITHIQNVMETVAVGAKPDGFTTIDLQQDVLTTPIAFNGLVIQPVKKYSNNDNDLYDYHVTNPSSSTVTLSETEFDGNSVSAISIFPKPNLKSGESTEVFVMTRKSTINALGLPQKEAQ